MCCRTGTIAIVAVITTVIVFGANAIVTADPDLHRNTTQIIEARGYRAELHVVQTSDGYLLDMQRIRAVGRSKGSVLLQHGLVDSSDTWILTSEDSPQQCLAFLLASSGYDVWLGNSRGNFYATRHVTLKPTDPAFWQFSFDEFAAYDLPSKVNYILTTTGEKKLKYVGHSEGTLMMFAHASSDPTFSDKIDVVAALAPVAFLGHIFGGFLRWITHLPDGALELLIGKNSFLTRGSGPIGEIVPGFCKVVPSACENVMCLLAGCASSSSVNATRMPNIMAHFPSGTSVRNIEHFQQAVEKNTFQKFDFGTDGNLRHYNQTTPPSYDLTKYNIPTAFFYGSTDTLADPTDVAALLKMVPKQTVLLQHEITDYGHADFIWADTAAKLVYEQIVRLFDSRAVAPS